MRGRRSSRSAAVVLAGCVGLAVMAPGLALAADPVTPTTDAGCAAQYGSGYEFDPVSSTCVEAPATATPPAVDPPNAGDTGDTGATPSNSSPSNDTPTADIPTGETSPSPAPGTTGESTLGTEGGDAGNAGGEGTQPAAPVAPISRAALANGVPELQDSLDASLADDLSPAALPLPNLPDIIPTPDADGNFENVNDACLSAISQLQFPEGTQGLDLLSEQLQGFCQQLDPTTLTDLLDKLLDVLNGLIPSLPTPGNPIPTEAPHYVPAEYGGYWHKQYDVDCPELTYDEANAILAWDRSDPFNLDGDDDGEACERNGDRVEYVEYIGYPVGGVATGDGSTGSGASGVEVALAAGALSGLGVTGLVLVRRFARQG